MALSAAVTGFVLAAPVVSSGSDEPTPSMLLDSSASSASAESSGSSESSASSAARYGDGSSPVVMGRDGIPDPSTTEAAETAETPELGGPADTADTAEAAPEAAEAAQAVEAAPVEEPAPAEATQAETPVTSEASSPAAATVIDRSPSSAPSSSASPSSAAAPARDFEIGVLALVNQARDRAGCDPLVADGGLAAAARAHSADMRDRDFFGHENPEGLDAVDLADAAGRTNAQAENVAHGQATPAAVVASWMDSGDDRENILDCDLETLGVGVAHGTDGPWWTAVFGD